MPLMGRKGFIAFATCIKAYVFLRLKNKINQFNFQLYIDVVSQDVSDHWHRCSVGGRVMVEFA